MRDITFIYARCHAMKTKTHAQTYYSEALYTVHRKKVYYQSRNGTVTARKIIKELLGENFLKKWSNSFCL